MSWGGGRERASLSSGVHSAADTCTLQGDLQWTRAALSRATQRPLTSAQQHKAWRIRWNKIRRHRRVLPDTGVWSFWVRTQVSLSSLSCLCLLRIEMRRLEGMGKEPGTRPA